jgi:NTP pyrophosphatase (non-canonical NTP hydrolase)
MNEVTSEVLDILQEECAEVIQAVSKIRRFGMDNFKYTGQETNKEHFEQELGDVLAMIAILLANGVVSQAQLDSAKLLKIEKLKKWSSIPHLDKI